MIGREGWKEEGVIGNRSGERERLRESHGSQLGPAVLAPGSGSGPVSSILKADNTIFKS